MKRCVTFGLNRVDQHAADYLGWDGALSGCIGDASAIVVECAKAGFECSSFIAGYDGEFTAYGGDVPDYRLIGDATRDNFRATFGHIAVSEPGDFWVVWFSGHGSQTRYVLTRDEGLCFFDGIMSDREIWSLFQKIPAGVKVLVGLDCCHAGGMPGTRERSGYYNKIKSCPIAFRGVGPGTPLEKGAIAGSLAVWAGCRQNQLSLDGEFNGLFTGTALTNFSQALSLSDWHAITAKSMAAKNKNQDPELELYGDTQPWRGPALL